MNTIEQDISLFSDDIRHIVVQGLHYFRSVEASRTYSIGDHYFPFCNLCNIHACLTRLIGFFKISNIKTKWR